MSDHYHYEYAGEHHDHRGQFADERHDHYDYAEKYHRHWDDESTVSGLREDLGHAEERIHALENDLRDAFERIRALEDGPVPDGGADPDRPETWAFAEPPGPGVRCQGCGALPDEQCGEECPERDPGPVWPGVTPRAAAGDEPEERGVSEYNREEFALDRGEEP